jgi:hypothetical protein
MAKKIVLRVPGSFVFIEQINRGNDPAAERRRVEALAMKAISKYFSFTKQERNEANYINSEN